MKAMRMMKWPGLLIVFGLLGCTRDAAVKVG